jgi:pimeloyl-ACP methyl ester carboxylesterase
MKPLNDDENMADTTRPTLLLVHGAWHGAWCWGALQPLLERAGRRVVTLDHPTVHAPNAASLGLQDDAAGVARAIDAIDGEVIVVAHSYGGVPTTIAATSPKVRHIVFIAAFALDEGESLFAAVGGVQPDWWDTDGAMVTAGNANRRPQDLFFADLDPAAADDATSRLRPQALRAFTEPVTAVAWRDRPTTYVVTEQDAIFPVPAQEGLAARSNSTVHRVPTSHSPYLSRPEAIAEIIEAVG